MSETKRGPNLETPYIVLKISGKHNILSVTHLVPNGL